MGALAAQDGGRAQAAPGLATLFAEQLAARPGAIAFVDPETRAAWSGRPRIAWSFRAAEPILARLETFFASLGLPPGGVVAVWLPGGAEACLTILALERAGLTPALVPMAFDREDAARAVEAAGAAALVTQGVVGELRPAEAARDVAMAYFGLRHVLAFGPHCPDGVLDLDRVIVDDRPPRAGRAEAAAAAAPEPGIVTVSRREGAVRAIWRPTLSWLTAAAEFLAHARYRPEERIVALLAQDDLAGLATGLVSTLLSGATLETHGLVDGRALAETLSDGPPARLLAPASIEPSLARIGRGAGALCGAVLVHAPPARFKARPGLTLPTVDVLALDEWALLARARGPGGQIALRLDERAAPGAALAVRRDEAGRILVSGDAALARRVGRSGAEAEAPAVRDTGLVAETFSGYLIGVS